jgi:hypothetical protein
MELTPPPKTLTAVLLRAACTITWFFSAALSGSGIIFTIQELTTSVPAGTIERLEPTKGGHRVTLAGKGQHQFPGAILFMQPEPIDLHPGDTVEKRWGSFTYTINGRHLGGFGWIVRNFLAPTYLIILLAAYFTFGAAYALIYRRSPLNDLQWRGMPSPPLRPQLPPRRALFAVFGWWAIGTVTAALLLSAMACCLFVVLTPLLPRH